MTRLHYDPMLKQWLIRCQVCGAWHTFIFETRDGEFCGRCLTKEEKEAA